MILVDFSQTIIAAVMAQTKNGKLPIEEGLIRYISLNMLRSYNSKFRKDYGELVVCCDHQHTWRKDMFPLYKKHRSAAKTKSKLDWNQMYRYMDIIIKEFYDFLPYRVIQVEGAEGDDVIATLVKNRGEGWFDKEQILIISGDLDFCQLQQLSNVRQYHPLKKRIIIEPHPQNFLLEHIICGDEGDGIPSVINPPNAIYDKLPKKRMTKKILESIKTGQFIQDEYRRRFEQNSTLIDLSYCPDEICRGIMYEFETQVGKDRSKLFNYFMNKKIKGLMQNIGDF